MAELFSFCWKSIFSKASCGSQDFSGTTFVQIYRAYWKKYYLVSQESFFEKKKKKKTIVLLFTKNWWKMT